MTKDREGWTKDRAEWSGHKGCEHTGTRSFPKAVVNLQNYSQLTELYCKPLQINSRRYDVFLSGSSKHGFYQGVAVGASVGSIYFLIFLVYSISFW